MRESVLYALLEYRSTSYFFVAESVAVLAVVRGISIGLAPPFLLGAGSGLYGYAADGNSLAAGGNRGSPGRCGSTGRSIEIRAGSGCAAG